MKRTRREVESGPSRRVRGVRRRCVAGTVAFALSAVAPVARVPPAHAQPEPARADASQEVQARHHFEVGIELFRRELWEAALGEFEQSSALFPTKPAAKNSALCLRRLGRAAEALEAYERIRASFADLSAEERRVVDEAVAQLSPRVGAIEVADGPDGAAVSIDGRDRGVLPAARSLRATVGAATVRVFKAGYLPFEQRIEVAAGRAVRVSVRLVALARSGTLRVAEPGGRAVDVLVDGAVAGKTPWEGLAAVGRHTVVLRGGGDQGTAPFEVEIREGATTEIARAVEPLPSALRIATTPAGAALVLDGVAVGTGRWDGRLPAGRHVVAASAPAHLDATREVILGRGQDLDVALVLPPARSAERPSRWHVEPTLGGVLTPTLGGDVLEGCAAQAGCERGLGAGASLLVHGGWRHGSGFGAGALLGGLTVSQTTRGRTAPIQAEGLGASTARVDDDLRITAALAGASVSAELGERFPVLLRLGGGVAFGAVSDTRTGSYTSRLPRAGVEGAAFALDLGPAQTEAGSWVFALPELRAGVRLAPGVVLGAGVAALVTFAITSPAWPASRRQPQQPDGLVHFDDERLGGSAAVLVVPEIALSIETPSRERR